MITSIHTEAKDHLPPYRVRPRFQIETNDAMDVVTDKILCGLRRENAPCKGRILQGYITLYLPPDQQHYWSPQLSLSLEESENGTLLRGLYGPNPVVWTMFVFFYSLIGFAILIISIIGFSYLSLDRSGAILWWVPVLALAFLSLYLVAYSGQKLGHDQMVTLHRFLEEQTGLTI